MNLLSFLLNKYIHISYYTYIISEFVLFLHLKIKNHVALFPLSSFLFGFSNSFLHFQTLKHVQNTHTYAHSLIKSKSNLIPENVKRVSKLLQKSQISADKYSSHARFRRFSASTRINNGENRQTLLSAPFIYNLTILQFVLSLPVHLLFVEEGNRLLSVLTVV